jgi:hypothetical protein
VLPTDGKKVESKVFSLPQRTCTEDTALVPTELLQFLTNWSYFSDLITYVKKVLYYNYT